MKKEKERRKFCGSGIVTYLCINKQKVAELDAKRDRVPVILGCDCYKQG